MRANASLEIYKRHLFGCKLILARWLLYLWAFRFNSVEFELNSSNFLSLEKNVNRHFFSHLIHSNGTLMLQTCATTFNIWQKFRHIWFYSNEEYVHFFKFLYDFSSLSFFSGFKNIETEKYELKNKKKMSWYSFIIINIMASSGVIQCRQYTSCYVLIWSHFAFIEWDNACVWHSKGSTLWIRRFEMALQKKRKMNNMSVTSYSPSTEIFVSQNEQILNLCIEKFHI